MTMSDFSHAGGAAPTTIYENGEPFDSPFHPHHHLYRFFVEDFVLLSFFAEASLNDLK